MTPPTELERLRAEVDDGIETAELYMELNDAAKARAEDAEKERDKLRAENERLVAESVAEAYHYGRGLRLANKRAEAWKAAAEALDGCVDWPKLPTGKVYSGYFTPEQDEAVTLLKAARQLEEPSE